MASILEKPFLIPDQDAVDGGTVVGSPINIAHVKGYNKLDFTPPMSVINQVDVSGNITATTSSPGYHIVFEYDRPGRRADRWSFLEEDTRDTEYDAIQTLLAQEIPGS